MDSRNVTYADMHAYIPRYIMYNVYNMCQSFGVLCLDTLKTYTTGQVFVVYNVSFYNVYNAYISRYQYTIIYEIDWVA